MKRRIKYQWAALFIIAAIILLPAISSFADTTTYQYDDTNHKIRVESGVVNPNPTYSISGIVTNASDGSALAGVTVSLGGVQTLTDSNGFYVFSELGNGSYTVTPTMNGASFSPASRPVTINGADAIAQNFTATFSAIYSISGTVTRGGIALPGVTMTLSGSATRTTTTNLSGTYIFNSLTNGSYTVTPTLNGNTFSPANRSVTVSGANASAQNFAATAPTLTVSSPNGGEIYSAGNTITISWTYTGDPTPVRIELYKSGVYSTIRQNKGDRLL